MYLGDFVEQLAAKLQRQKVTMPFENERPWHELFYELKRRVGDGKPDFFGELRFDWDGPYPKCAELSEFIHSLHWNACVDARNPHFDTMSLPEEIVKIWLDRADALEGANKAFLEGAVTAAKENFGAVAA